MNHAHRIARKAAGRIAMQRGLPHASVYQVCCLATLALHRGASLQDAVGAARRLADTLKEENDMSAIQRQQPIAEITACEGCNRQPRMYHESTGGGRWFLECSPCGTRTARFRSRQEAVESWERHETRAITEQAAA